MIEKMKAICVAAQSSHKDELLSSLRDLGLVHIAEKKSADSIFLERFSMISKLLSELKSYEVKENSSSKIISDAEFENLYEDSVKALETKNALTTRLSELNIELESLKAWGEFDAKAINDLKSDVDFHFYRLDKRSYKALCEDENVKFIRLSPVDKMDTVAVIGTLDQSFNAIEFVIPQKGPAELKDELEKCKKELSKCENTLKEAAKHLKSYSNALVSAQEDIEYSSADKTLTSDDSIVWITGYIPVADEERFTAAAKEHHWAFIASDVEEDDGSVPTKIRYNKITSIVKPVFDLLGVVPGYGEYDISFWFLAFFSLFFAMILGDAGYGAILLIGAIAFNIISKKITNIILLLYLLSGSTIIWGAVTGTWFGFESAMEIPFLKALVIPSIANYPEYFSVSSTVVQNTVMKFCFSIGYIQLALACAMNVRRKIAQKNLAFVADIGWLLSISALYFIVLSLVIGQNVNLLFMGAVVGIGFILVVLFGGMEPGKSFSAGLKSGLGNIFTVFLDTISAFGNIMSYIRLFAVGMASLAIAQSFNGMAEGFDGVLVIVGAVIMIIGHVLNLVMGFLSVVVHGVRLNLMEFSGQLGMEWSGKQYEPFKKIKK